MERRGEGKRWLRWRAVPLEEAELAPTLFSTELSLPPSFVHEEVEVRDGRVTMVCNVADEESLQRWLHELRGSEGLGWVVLRKMKTVNFVLSHRYNCQHSSKNKSKDETDATGRNTGCPAQLRVFVRKTTRRTMAKYKHVKDGFPCEVSFDLNHNHTLKTADAMRLLRPVSSLRNTFEQLFEQGLRPREAAALHRRRLKQSTSPSELPNVLANAALCPADRTVDWWWEESLRKQLKGDAVQLMEERKETFGEFGHHMSFNHNVSCVAIQTAVMRRVLAFPTSADCFLMDSTASVDCEGHALTLLSVDTPIGPLPVGALVTKSMTADAYKESLGLWQGLLH